MPTKDLRNAVLPYGSFVLLINVKDAPPPFTVGGVTVGGGTVALLDRETEIVHVSTFARYSVPTATPDGRSDAFRSGWPELRAEEARLAAVLLDGRMNPLFPREEQRRTLAEEAASFVRRLERLRPPAALASFEFVLPPWSVELERADPRYLEAWVELMLAESFTAGLLGQSGPGDAYFSWLDRYWSSVADAAKTLSKHRPAPAFATCHQHAGDHCLAHFGAARVLEPDLQVAAPLGQREPRPTARCAPPTRRSTSSASLRGSPHT